MTLLPHPDVECSIGAQGSDNGVIDAPPLTVSVITCIYTAARWDNLMALVASLRRQTLCPQQIIVVVDHNPDLLARLQRVISGIVISNVNMRGAAGSRNCGVAAAGSDIIAFIDDDAEADPEWLARLMACYISPSVIGVGGSISPRWATGKPRWFPAEFSWIVGCTYRGMPRKQAVVRNLIAANMSMRHDAFLSLQGFRAEFGKVGDRPRPEDTELCIRTNQRWPHSRWLYEPASRVYHHVSPSRATWHYFLKRCFHEGLGKADLAALVGTRDSFDVEKSYIRTTLPVGVLMGLADLVVHGDIMGIARAAAIVCGLSATIAGCLFGWAVSRIPLAKRNTSQQGCIP